MGPAGQPTELSRKADAEQLWLLCLKASQHNVPEPNLFQVYALAHKAPFRSAMPYNDSNTSSAYTSKSAYDRMVTLKSTTKKMKGIEYDVTYEPLDHKLVMIAGGGRKHGTEAIGGGMFPNSSHRTLPEYKAWLGIPKSSICQRKTPAMVDIESRLEEERRLADERLEARLAEERRHADANRESMVDHQFIDSDDSLDNLSYNLVFSGVTRDSILLPAHALFDSIAKNGFRIMREDIIAYRNTQATAEQEP
ncbi:hypothetical protein D1007_50490 [Hordeum vulgare]|nr:hypothetical protein D1007_50490 [Hordeum vulgare]